MTKAIVRKDVKKFTIKRSKWFRGKGALASKLLNNEGKMCCLGFYGIACGLRPQDIRNQSAPANVAAQTEKWNTFLLIKDKSYGGLRDSDAASRLMEVNDDDSISDKKREKKITEEFLKQNIKVKFVD